LKLTNVHKRKKNGHNFEKNIEVWFHHLCKSFFVFSLKSFFPTVIYNVYGKCHLSLLANKNIKFYCFFLVNVQWWWKILNICELQNQGQQNMMLFWLKHGFSQFLDAFWGLYMEVKQAMFIWNFKNKMLERFY
jgi:hypothetical protein